MQESRDKCEKELTLGQCIHPLRPPCQRGGRCEVDRNEWTRSGPGWNLWARGRKATLTSCQKLVIRINYKCHPCLESSWHLFSFFIWIKVAETSDGLKKRTDRESFTLWLQVKPWVPVKEHAVTGDGMAVWVTWLTEVQWAAVSKVLARWVVANLRHKSN